jgi:hypothetical protein
MLRLRTAFLKAFSTSGAFRMSLNRPVFNAANPQPKTIKKLLKLYKPGLRIQPSPRSLDQKAVLRKKSPDPHFSKGFVSQSEA